MKKIQKDIQLGTLGTKTIQLTYNKAERGTHYLTVSLGKDNDAQYLAGGSDGVLSVAERELYTRLRERGYSAIANSDILCDAVAEAVA